MTRIHVISLPHTLLTRKYEYCAYTAKVWRLAQMLHGRHEMLLYGPDIRDQSVNDAVTDYIPVVFEADRQEWFGTPEWDTSHVFDRWDTEDITWTTMNTRAAAAIRERWQPGDLIGVIGGLCQQQIATALADLNPIIVEWGIGYSGVMPTSVKVFESYAWMHHVAGLRHADDVAFFDTVIPNCFDPDDLTFGERPGDYLLYMGRPIDRKGLPVIRDMLKRIDTRLVVAGQPGHNIDGKPGQVEYVGVVTGKQKADLLAGALATLVPSMYLEPFGGVSVESMLSGTPVITTDWGAFTETVTQGVTGFRCRMLSDFVDAVHQADQLHRGRIYAHALSRWSTRVGADLYDRYLTRVSTLHREGWYAPSDSAFRPFR